MISGLRGFLFLMLILGSAAALAQSGKALPDIPARVSGSLRSVLDYEEDEIAGHDTTFSQYLRLDAHPVKHPASFHFYGRARFDLDGESVTDQALDRSDNRIFQAFMELREFSDVCRLRLGRQWVHEIEGVFLDGVRFDIPAFGNTEWTFFGGMPASAYSSGAGQKIFGGQVAFHPFGDTLLRIDAVRSDEENLLVNDHVGLHVSQGIGRHARLFYDQKLLNDREKDLRLAASAHIPILQLDVRASWYNRLNRSPVSFRDNVEARYFSEYFLLLSSVEELNRYSFQAFRYFGERFAASASFSDTRIRDQENPTNRDSSHVALSVHFFDVFASRLNISVDANWADAKSFNRTTEVFTDVDGTGNVVNTEIRLDDASFFLTGQVEYAFVRGVRLAVGSTYGDSEFDRAVLTDQPVLDIVPRSQLITNPGDRFITRTYFGEVYWKIDRSWWVKIRPEYDRSRINSGAETGDYTRIVGSVGYKF